MRLGKNQQVQQLLSLSDRVLVSSFIVQGDVFTSFYHIRQQIPTAENLQEAFLLYPSL